MRGRLHGDPRVVDTAVLTVEPCGSNLDRPTQARHPQPELFRAPAFEKLVYLTGIRLIGPPVQRERASEESPR